MTENIAQSDSSLFAGSFADFQLPDALLSGVTDLGYQTPTQIQQAVFKPVLDGRDLVAQSHTGSGKTTGFCLPLLAKLDLSAQKPQVLVLAPTRELAKQVATECKRLGFEFGAKVVAVYGGASMEAQIAALRSTCHVVVGTPGRVKDLMERGILKTSDVKTVVLDEADEMLSMGFWEDVCCIVDSVPQNRQTLLFSATFPAAIESGASRFLKDPVRVDLSTDNVPNSSVKHVLVEENQDLPKQRNLLYALEAFKPDQAIIFCNRKEETDLLEKYLRRFGFTARALNGDMNQTSRERVMDALRSKELQIVIATDVAARGIDISDLTHVFNYDLPENDEVYVHRIGRTGRIGKTGVAVSLVRGKNITQTAQLSSKFDVVFHTQALPPEKEIMWFESERIAARLVEEADGVETSQYKPIADSLLGRPDVTEIIAFLLRSHFNIPMAPSQEERGGLDSGNKSRNDHSRPSYKSSPVKPEPKVQAPAPITPIAAPPTGDATVKVSIGLKHGVSDVISLVHLLSKLSGVDSGFFTGFGQIFNEESQVEIEREVADDLVSKLHGRPFEGRTPINCFFVEPARQAARPYFSRGNPHRR